MVRFLLLGILIFVYDIGRRMRGTKKKRRGQGEARLEYVTACLCLDFEGSVWFHVLVWIADVVLLL